MPSRPYSRGLRHGNLAECTSRAVVPSRGTAALGLGVLADYMLFPAAVCLVVHGVSPWIVHGRRPVSDFGLSLLK